ncbi:GDSL esterase/lipase [Quillaja saponaria]|uniref:GDSL esterase/lipase n=1 Tax=Quillaja saponaria TaxID=32244 RepID=A0AAD7PFN3_QUISA|nr:GDSL esterase/lipase [Quillaja saponaria]
MDTGNNNNLSTIMKCNFKPYGRNFIGGKPTGRFCYGKNAADFFAEGFGVKQIVPAYFEQNLHLQDLFTGMCFASGGAGYDPLTNQIAASLSLDQQLSMFRYVIEKLEADIGLYRTLLILRKSIYIVSIGNDDISNTYYLTPFRSFHYDEDAYTDMLINLASTFYQELYGVGARRIGVVNLGPLGCIPIQRTINGGLSRQCADKVTETTVLFNKKLASLVITLNKKFPGAKFVYLDAYSLLMGIIENPGQYGFEVVDRGCCGTGLLETLILCNKYSPLTCEDDTKYVFWDSYHPTEKGYSIVVSQSLMTNIDKFF